MVNTLRMSALTASMAATGPGCGGTSAWSTERPASAGMPTSSTGCLARRATERTTGMRRTTPISKNIGRPMMAATSAIIHGRAAAFTPKTSLSTMALPPPESASSWPTMAPSATSRPTEPTVVPNPVVKLFTAASPGTHATSASAALPRMSARNGCSLAAVMPRTTTAMPASAASASCPDDALESGSAASAARKWTMRCPSNGGG